MTLRLPGHDDEPVVALPRPLPAVLLLELQDTDRPSLHDGALGDGSVDDHDRIERIAVLSGRLGHEPEVEREGHSGRQRPIDAIRAQLGVKLELVARAARRLDNDDEQAAYATR